MIDQIQGVVIEIDGSLAKVKTSRHGECSSCGLCPGDSALVLDVYNGLGAKPGQRVIVEVKPDNVLLAAFIVYMAPLILTGIGCVLGYYLARGINKAEVLFEVLGGVVFFTISVFYIKYFDKSLKTTQNLPVIVEICKSNTSSKADEV